MIKIIADTTSTLSLEVARKNGIPYLPQIIVFGNESYRDDTEMDTQTFIRRLRASSTLPGTAAPPPAMYAPYLKEGAEKGDTIIIFTPSADVSGTYRNAVIAAKDFPDADIRVFDTRSIAAGLGTLVLEAVKWVSEGLDADTVIARVKEMQLRERIYFYVDTLEYLYKGGRIGGAKALFGSLLQMKPLLTFREGHIESLESQRTKKRALARLTELVVTESAKGANAHLKLMQGDAVADCEILVTTLKASLDIQEIPIVELPPAILVHSGPGAIAISFFVD